MKIKRDPNHLRGTALVATLVLSSSIYAIAATASIEHDFEVDWAFVGSSRIKGEGTRFDSGDGMVGHISYVLSPQISSRVLLHFGAEWQRLTFDVPDPSPVPDTLQEATGILGLDWQLHDKWLIRARISPGVYSDFEDVSWNDMNAPALLAAMYLAKPELQWFMGIRVDPRSEYPVIPAVGVRWRFQEDWTLSAIFPQPRIEYDVTPGLKAYFGGTFQTGTYRVGEHFGEENGWPELNGEMLSYFEARVGPGLLWKATPHLDLGLNAGYSVYRSFDFADRDRTFRADPTPYVQVSAKVEF